MSTVVQIETLEIRAIMKSVQRFQALNSVKKTLQYNPERVEEFGYSWDDFANLDNDLKSVDSECRDWWNTIAQKYDLPKDVSFKVRYTDNSLIVG